MSELRQVAPETGEVLQTLIMPEGAKVTGLESGRGGLFYCGGGASGKVRAARRTRPR